MGSTYSTQEIIQSLDALGREWLRLEREVSSDLDKFSLSGEGTPQLVNRVKEGMEAQLELFRGLTEFVPEASSREPTTHRSLAFDDMEYLALEAKRLSSRIQGAKNTQELVGKIAREVHRLGISEGGKHKTRFSQIQSRLSK